VLPGPKYLHAINFLHALETSSISPQLSECPAAEQQEKELGRVSVGTIFSKLYYCVAGGSAMFRTTAFLLLVVAPLCGTAQAQSRPGGLPSYHAPPPMPRIDPLPRTPDLQQSPQLSVPSPPPATAYERDRANPEPCDCLGPNYVETYRDGRRDWIQNGCKVIGRNYQCCGSTGC
jgi:hypothetical protein